MYNILYNQIHKCIYCILLCCIMFLTKVAVDTAQVVKYTDRYCRHL
jgi:hypothetical protein